MTSADMLQLARDALSPGNARTYDGDPNFKKKIVITTGVVGPYNGTPGGLAFEVKVPRSVVNELGFTVYWGDDGTVDKTEAAAFLRELADLVEAIE